MKRLLFILLILPLTLFAQIQNEHKDFDFWLGEWKVYKTGTDQFVGNSKIESINDGFAIIETYSTPSGYKGSSLNNYNKLSGKWEQYWSDNTGFVLHMSGGVKNNSMVMDDILLHHDHSTHNRITWTPNEDGTVRQVWEQSYDEDFSWSVIFDGTYVPR
jgi:hypothetical protein